MPWRVARVRSRVVQNCCYAARGWDRQVREFCAANDLLYQGVSLLTANRAVLASSELSRIAADHDRTLAQIVFRFALQIGMLPLTGTTSAAHMHADIDGFDFRLTAAEMRQIEHLGARRTTLPGVNVRLGGRGARERFNRQHRSATSELPEPRQNFGKIRWEFLLGRVVAFALPVDGAACRHSSYNNPNPRWIVPSRAKGLTMSGDMLLFWLQQLEAQPKQAARKVCELTYQDLSDRVNAIYPIFRRLRRWEDAEDIFQQASLRLEGMVAACKPNTREALDACLKVCVRRVYVDRARHWFGPNGVGTRHQSRAADRSGEQNELGPVDGAADHNMGPATHAEERDLIEQLDRHLTSLPPDLYETVILRLQGGLSASEVAELMQRDESTVRRWYRKALRKLRFMLRESSVSQT